MVSGAAVSAIRPAKPTVQSRILTVRANNQSEICSNRVSSVYRCFNLKIRPGSIIHESCDIFNNPAGATARTKRQAALHVEENFAGLKLYCNATDEEHIIKIVKQ